MYPPAAPQSPPRAPERYPSQPAYYQQPYQAQQYPPQPAAYQQPYQPQQYPPQPAPPRGKTAGKTAAVIAVVITVVVIAVALFLALGPGLSPQGGGHVETALGLRLEETPSGDWQIDITGGSAKASDLTLVVIDAGTGATAYNSRLDALDSDVAEFTDDNGNGKLDTGDSIVLIQGDTIEAGMKVELLKGENILGMVKELPTIGGHIETAFGLRVEKTSSVDWLISIVSGSQNASLVTMQVLNTGTGAVAYTHLVGSPDAANFVFNDNNGNGKLDAGDSIVLKDTSTVDAGMKVQFIKGGNIVGTIKELPS